MPKYSGDHIICIVSGAPGADYHHIKTRGAGGTDDVWNMIPVSSPLHRLIHSQGLNKVAQTFPQVRAWLERHGWEFNDLSMKWRHE